VDGSQILTGVIGDQFDAAAEWAVVGARGFEAVPADGEAREPEENRKGLGTENAMGPLLPVGPTQCWGGGSGRVYTIKEFLAPRGRVSIPFYCKSCVSSAHRNSPESARTQSRYTRDRMSTSYSRPVIIFMTSAVPRARYVLRQFLNCNL
jgi:hypothetical protein